VVFAGDAEEDLALVAPPGKAKKEETKAASPKKTGTGKRGRPPKAAGGKKGPGRPKTAQPANQRITAIHTMRMRRWKIKF